MSGVLRLPDPPMLSRSAWQKRVALEALASQAGSTPEEALVTSALKRYGEAVDALRATQWRVLWRATRACPVRPYLVYNTIDDDADPLCDDGLSAPALLRCAILSSTVAHEIFDRFDRWGTQAEFIADHSIQACCPCGRVYVAPPSDASRDDAPFTSIDRAQAWEGVVVATAVSVWHCDQCGRRMSLAMLATSDGSYESFPR